MGNFIVWDISSKTDGVWKNVTAETAQAAAEALCGQKLRTVGEDADICARVRSLDAPNALAATFYGEKSGAAAKEKKRQQELREMRAVTLQAAE